MADELQVFRGKDYELNSKITIHQPTLDEICRYGEHEYFSMITMICSTPADRKVEIWDRQHVYWDKVDEYELFLGTFPAIGKEDLSIIFPTLDTSSFTPSIPNGQRLDNLTIVLVNKDGVVIDRAIYKLMTDYIRNMHNMKKNVDVPYNKYTADIMIEDDRDEMARLKNKPYKSNLLPMISAMTNYRDFKYDWNTVWDLPISVFMDAIARVQVIRRADQLSQGIYAGTVDFKKLDKRLLDWMSDIKK